MDEVTWKKILGEVKPISVSIGGLLGSAKPLEMKDDNLKLGVYYKFHKDKLEEIKNKKILEEVFQKVLGREVSFECVITDIPVKSELTQTTNQNIIGAAEEIFS